MQVELDAKCMKTNFGGCDHSGFGDFASFCLPSNLAKFLIWTMHAVQKIELTQNIHASRG